MTFNTALLMVKPQLMSSALKNRIMTKTNRIDRTLVSPYLCNGFNHCLPDKQ